MEKFIEKVTEGISEYIGEEGKVEYKRVKKNNGVILSGIVILKNGQNVAPTIYLEPFYKKYMEGVSLGEIVLEVLQYAGKYQVEENLDMSFFLSYESVKERIFLKLIHFQKNKELLETIPHICVWDLAIVFYYEYSNDFIGEGSILINEGHRECWNITIEEMYEKAKENTRRYHPFEIRKMQDVLAEIFCDKTNSMEDEFTEEMIRKSLNDALQSCERTAMYVLTNKNRVFGAVHIIMKETLDYAAEIIGKSFYILPSSIHEVILLPDTGKEKPGDLEEMVREVNNTQLEADEVLSDAVYYYEKDEHQVYMLKKRTMNK